MLLIPWPAEAPALWLSAVVLWWPRGFVDVVWVVVVWVVVVGWDVPRGLVDVDVVCIVIEFC